MSPEEEAARLEAWHPIIEWMQAQAEHTIVEYADVFTLLRKAKAHDPAVEKLLMAGLSVLEDATPEERADILRAIHVKSGRGRKPGSGFHDEAFVDEYLRRRASGERPEMLKIDIAQRMPGGGALESKAKRLERAVGARQNSLPSSPVK